MYYLYRKLATRHIMRDYAFDIEEAKSHLSKEGTRGYVTDDNGNIYNTIEELENAESIRSKPRSWEDHFVPRGSEVSEDSDRELSESDTDNTE